MTPPRAARLLPCLLVALPFVFASGCTSPTGGGGPFGLFPEGQRLTDSARQLRAASPAPLPLPRELEKQVTAAYVVEPGDVLLIQPADLDSPARLPGDQPVLADGTVTLGRYGRALVAGMTLEQIEAEVRRLVEAQTKDAGPITARVVLRQSKVYYVLGEVNAPGAFQLNGRETVLDALLQAGGLTNRASRPNIILSRPTRPTGCRVVLPVCYDEIVQVGDTATNYQIAAGDRVFVPAKGFIEDLFHMRKDCPPCGGPHVPCSSSGAGGCAPGETAAPAQVPQTISYHKPAAPAAGTVSLPASPQYNAGAGAKPTAYTPGGLLDVRLDRPTR